MSDNKFNYEAFLFGKIGSSDLLTGFVIGHLVIEHLLEEIVVNYDKNLKAHFLTLNHSRKISFIQSLGLFPDKVASCLQSINKMRNRFAHQLGYEPNKGELLNLIDKCRDGFSDLTDGLTQLHDAVKKTDSVLGAQEQYGVGLADLFIQIVYDLEQYADTFE